MSSRLLKIGAATVVLFVLSLVTYHQEHKRGTDLVAGSDFIVGFDVDKVVKIEIQKDKEKLVLSKEGGGYVLENFHSYPADNERINELLFKIANIQIGDKVTDSKSAHKDYELDDKLSKARIIGYDGNGKKTLDFYVGKNKKNRGPYLRFSDKDAVYFSQGPLWFSASKDSYIKKELLSLKEDEVQEITLVSNDKEIVLERKGKDWAVKGEDEKKIDKEKIKEVVSGTQSIEFNDFGPRQKSQLNDTPANFKLKLKLKNKIVYQMNYYKSGKKYYLRASSILTDVPNQVVINKDDDQEKLSSIEETIKAQNAATNFNVKNSNWVYEIDEDDYGDIADFLENINS